MLVLISKRCLSLMLSLLAASLVIFMVVEILPGDPAEIMAGMNATPETIASLRQQYGLDLSVQERYIRWITRFLIGDFGQSYTYSVPVRQLFLERLSVSIPLGLLSMMMTLALACPIGIFTAIRHDTKTDKFLMFFMQLGVAIPNFLLGLLFIFLFSVNLQWFSGSGFPGWKTGLFHGLSALLLPAFVLALPQVAILSRALRSSLLDVLSEDFIRTARAKGLSRFRTVLHHAFKNALPPVLTLMGLQFSFLIGGTIVIENVFALSGIGRLVIQALNNRDLIVVESVSLLLVAGVILVSFLIDLIVILMDPRLRRPT